MKAIEYLTAFEILLSKCSDEEKSELQGCCKRVARRGQTTPDDTGTICKYVETHLKNPDVYHLVKAKSLPMTMPLPKHLIKSDADLARVFAWILSFPLPAETKGLLTYYASVSDIVRGRRTPMKYGRFLTNVLKVSDLETTRAVEKMRVEQDAYEVKFIGNDDPEGWVECYSSAHIDSCMQDSKSVRCYAASGFGLPDNGLRLAYIGASPADAVARCIIHEPTRKYIRVYGDSYLLKALQKMGYRKVQSELRGIKLWTEHVEQGFYRAPHLDCLKTQKVMLHEPEGGIPYLEVGSKGARADRSGFPFLRFKLVCDHCHRHLPLSMIARVKGLNRHGQVGWHDAICEDCARKLTVDAKYISGFGNELYVRAMPDAVEERNGVLWVKEENNGTSLFN